VLLFDGSSCGGMLASIATTFEAGRTVVRVAGRLAQAVLSATSRAGPLPVVEGPWLAECEQENGGRPAKLADVLAVPSDEDAQAAARA
jgi:hypothetical protein